MKNWIEDENRFKLTSPPKWFLQRLKDFDPSLVILPSRQKMAYRLAQRRPPDPRISTVEKAFWQESDTRMLAGYALVPVCTISPTVNWDNPLIFKDLEAKAPWMQGGAAKVIERLEAEEAVRDGKVHDYSKALMHDRAVDAWSLLRKKMGLGRTFHHQGSPKMRPATS